MGKIVNFKSQIERIQERLRRIQDLLEPMSEGTQKSKIERPKTAADRRKEHNENVIQLIGVRRYGKHRLEDTEDSKAECDETIF